MPSHLKQEVPNYAIDALAARWEGEPTHILVHAFSFLAEGKPAPIRELARRAGVSEKLAIDQVRQSKASTDDQQNITALFGVGFAPTPHNVITTASSIFTCCGMVAQSIAFLTGKAIRIRSIDPISGSVVAVDVSPTGSTRISPDQAVCTFAHGDYESIINHPYQAFCRHVRYFESEETANEFALLEKERFLVTVEDCNRAAKKLAVKAWNIA